MSDEPDGFAGKAERWSETAYAAPDAYLTHRAALVASLGVLAIIYGAFCAMAQTDWKKLVAYSSVSHMGFSLLGMVLGSLVPRK